MAYRYLSTDNSCLSFYKLYRKALNNFASLFLYLDVEWIKHRGSNTCRKEKLVGN